MQFKQTSCLVCNSGNNNKRGNSRNNVQKSNNILNSNCWSRNDSNDSNTNTKSHKMQIVSNAEVIYECNMLANAESAASHLPAAAVASEIGCRCQAAAVAAGNVTDTTGRTTRAMHSWSKLCNFSIHSSRCGSTNTSNNNFNRILTVTAVLLFIFTWCDLAHATLSNVNLFVEPPAVRQGQSVTLRCSYNLEGAPLYSVKFYRGHLEFFRYTPGEYPNTKVLHFPGIKVDESVSNATQVVIRNVSFGLSGNFSCEVTADAPLFSTATAYAQMQVVEFPEKRPQLFTEQTRYEPGEILRANCSTQPSRPRADLRFTINNIPVSSGETQYIRTVDNLIASRLSLKLQLQSIHFTGASNSHMMNTLYGGGGAGPPYNTQGGAVPTGSLVLRCTAQIDELYQEYKEIELGAQLKDPVPARVTLSSGSSFRNFFETYFSASTASTSTLRMLTARGWQRQWLTMSLAAGAIGAFHWLQLCRCR